jgi:hypothetical protein
MSYTFNNRNSPNLSSSAIDFLRKYIYISYISLYTKGLFTIKKGRKKSRLAALRLDYAISGTTRTTTTYISYTRKG